MFSQLPQSSLNPLGCSCLTSGPSQPEHWGKKRKPGCSSLPLGSVRSDCRRTSAVTPGSQADRGLASTKLRALAAKFKSNIVFDVNSRSLGKRAEGFASGNCIRRWRNCNCCESQDESDLGIRKNLPGAASFSRGVGSTSLCCHGDRLAPNASVERSQPSSPQSAVTGPPEARASQSLDRQMKQKPMPHTTQHPKVPS